MNQALQTTQKIGELIQYHREKQGLTQAEFARLLATSQSAVARMEKGEQNFTAETLVKVSSILKRDIITLSGDSLNFKIHGGRQLSGEVQINSSKNATVAILCASLLNKGKTILHKVPQIAEIERLIEVLESMNVKVRWFNNSSLEIIPPTTIDIAKLDFAAAKKTRSAILLMGVLSHFFPEFQLPAAGGCHLGLRSVQPHVYALNHFGINVQRDKDFYNIIKTDSKDSEVILYESGDTVTENAILAAALSPRVTQIKYASANYMVQDLCKFLEVLGVEFRGIGTTTIQVKGLETINKTVEYTISPDPIEAMFFLAAAVVTKSTLSLKGCPIEFLELELYKLSKMGLRCDKSETYLGDNNFIKLVDLTIHPSNLCAPVEKIECRPYPGVNMDNLPFFALLATQAQGTTLIHDWPYEHRAIYYTELNKLGATVRQADIHRVYIQGVTTFVANDIKCPPALRPAALLLIALLAADGTSTLKDVYSINRGYEDLVNRLNKLGAKIEFLQGI
jgi:UDP-N-acetylglucosamine 1-carboxyvinyltransferase